MEILLTDLEATNPQYDPIVQQDSKNGALRALQTYSDFYSGGRSFTKHRDRYLRSRPIEANAGSYRDNRLTCAYYTPHSGGIGDNLCGTALQYPPTIEIKTPSEAPKTGLAGVVQKTVNAIMPKPKDDPRKQYWQNLNDNINGNGADSRALAWCLLSNLIIHRRAYIAVNYPEGSEDATYSALGAKQVDDWQKDEDDNYEWIRTHSMDLVRSRPFGPVDAERHTWEYFTATDITKYVAERPINGSWPNDLKSVTGVSRPHGHGEVPIYPIEVEENFWVMDRLFSTAHAYFNREASRSFAIDTGALSLPVVKTGRDVTQLVMANGYCIKLNADANEDFFYRSQDAGIYKALQDDCDYLLGNLYGALNQMALTAAGQAGNPRQSGTAKTADAQAIKAFLSLLCAPIMAAFRKAFKAVQKFRNEEDLIIEVHGMSNFDVQNIELEINRCISFTSIPNMPKTAMKEAKRKLIRVYLPDIDEREKALINTELDTEETDSVEPPEDTSILTGTTKRPDGFSPDQVSQQYNKAAKAENAA